jgi:hypothetical protein
MLVMPHCKKTLNQKQLTELYNIINTLSLHSSIQQTERQIKHIEDKINTLVYQLYKLKKEEVELIERN